MSAILQISSDSSSHSSRQAVGLFFALIASLRSRLPFLMTSLANVSNPSCDTSSLKANSPVVAPDFDFRATDGLSNAEIKSTRSGVCTKERLAKETRLGRRRTARIFENISKVDINVVSSR